MLELKEYQLICPYCGEIIAVLVDISAGDQQYYEDCQVCCAPIFFDLIVHHDDSFTLNVKQEAQ